MKLLAVFFFLMIAISGFAQEDRVLFKFAPLAMLDEVSFPTVQTGVEVSLGIMSLASDTEKQVVNRLLIQILFPPAGLK